MFRVYCCLALLLMHGASSVNAHAQSSRPPATAGPLRVLFVGNSYTYENNLPFVFESLADPVRDVAVTMVASGGASLRRHIDVGGILDTIRRGHFDIVVAQEQSLLGRRQFIDGVSLIDQPAQYHEAVRQIAETARSSGARLVLFSTWPRCESPRNVVPLHNASITIARDVGATVAPVGLVWDYLRGDASESLRLYGDDCAHPGKEGTYVAAVVLVRSLLGRMPELRPVRHVPLMDGRAKPDGSFADIAPTAAGLAAIGDAVAAAYSGPSPAYLAELPADAPALEPALPSVVLRGRITSPFLQGAWKGTFATFGPEYQATLSLDLRGSTASVTMIHPESGWPKDDVLTGVPFAIDRDGVLTLSYPSTEKGCRVHIAVVRFGNTLRGTVRFTLDDGQPWVRSHLTLEKTSAPVTSDTHGT